MKTLNLQKTIYELTEEHPELIDLLANLGFLGVRSTVVRNTLGRKMTLAEGCRAQRKDVEAVIEHLESRGFVVLADDSG